MKRGVNKVVIMRDWVHFVKTGKNTGREIPAQQVGVAFLRTPRRVPYVGPITHTEKPGVYNATFLGKHVFTLDTLNSIVEGPAETPTPFTCIVTAADEEHTRSPYIIEARQVNTIEIEFVFTVRRN